MNTLTYHNIIHRDLRQTEKMVMKGTYINSADRKKTAAFMIFPHFRSRPGFFLTACFTKSLLSYHKTFIKALLKPTGWKSVFSDLPVFSVLPLERTG